MNTHPPGRPLFSLSGDQKPVQLLVIPAYVQDARGHKCQAKQEEVEDKRLLVIASVTQVSAGTTSSI